MSFSEDKNKMVEYMQKGELKDWEDEQELEEFFCFIDRLEENVKEDSSYFSVLAEAYLKAGNPLKAKEAFSKVCNPKNKKDLKKLSSFASLPVQPVVRPAQRAKVLPGFLYVDGNLLKNKFVQKEDSICCICKKKSVALYVGMAYTDTSEKIDYLNHENKFCADCIKDGNAAAELGLKFNDPEFIEEITIVDADKKSELLNRTPECSSAFDFDEDIWPCCCGDFCRYINHDNKFEEKFTFKCLHCGKEIVWTKMT